MSPGATVGGATVRGATVTRRKCRRRKCRGASVRGAKGKAQMSHNRGRIPQNHREGMCLEIYLHISHSLTISLLHFSLCRYRIKMAVYNPCCCCSLQTGTRVIAIIHLVSLQPLCSHIYLSRKAAFQPCTQALISEDILSCFFISSSFTDLEYNSSYFPRACRCSSCSDWI